MADTDEPLDLGVDVVQESFDLHDMADTEEPLDLSEDTDL